MKNIFLAFMLLLSNLIGAQCLVADIVFVLDWSGSQEGKERYMVSAIYDFVEELPFGPTSLKAGIVVFTDGCIYEYSTPVTSDKDFFLFMLGELSRIPAVGGTNISSGLYLARSYLEKSYLERKDHDGGLEPIQLVVLISDGDEGENNYPRSQTVATLIKLDPLCRIYSLYSRPDYIYGLSGPHDHMYRLSSGEEYFSRADYTGLKEELERMNLCP